MQIEEPITKISKIIQRPGGSEVRITACACFGAGLESSTDVYVHRRESPKHDWILCNDRPHPDWRKMSVDDYMKHGRSEKLQAVSHGEIFKWAGFIGKPLSSLAVA